MFCLVNLNALATHYLGFYVYVERQYVQGPWQRVNLFNKQENSYLEPHFHEDLLGSLDDDLISVLMAHLKEHSPQFYQWSYELHVVEDTVFINTFERVDNFERVVNEITATLVLNGFNTVCFSKMPVPNEFTINDISIPYFDLKRNGNPTGEILTPIVKIPKISKTREVDNQNNQQSFWWVISVILNVVFVVVLVFRS